MRAYMVVGGQWGSEGKGLFAGYIAQKHSPDAVVSQFGPNAGHTWIQDGKPIVFKALPVASIIPSVGNIFLGPGSVINPSVLAKEIEGLQDFISQKSIYVHEMAAILEPGDAEVEQTETVHIASTMQGTAEAIIRKIRRKSESITLNRLAHLPVTVLTHDSFVSKMQQAHVLQVEGSQGMDLSINGGWLYPYVTSRDCTPSQVLADCALHPHDLVRIYACIRTYPIRVGNVMGGNGLVLGRSGPCYPDQTEINWSDLGVTEEYTTVTKRVRRVFTFSMMQLRKMLRDVRPDEIFLNFGNYMKDLELDALIRAIDEAGPFSRMVRYVGHGPDATDVEELYPAATPKG